VHALDLDRHCPGIMAIAIFWNELRFVLSICPTRRMVACQPLNDGLVLGLTHDLKLELTQRRATRRVVLRLTPPLLETCPSGVSLNGAACG